LPDLTDVIAAVEQSIKAIVSVAIGDDLIGSAAAQLDFSLARDTVPREPSIEELAKGVVFRRYTTAPELLNKPEIAHLLEARYPPDLIALDVQGVTALWLLIDQSGAIRKAKIARSSGHAWLDRIAMQMVPRMHFSAALNNGHATAVWVQLPVRFKVQDGQ
jgi:TonB family protein